ncbi:DUF6142 family protein [Anaeromicropila populeti]|uniref:Uncharacterized protein n=1 Tax=Anaeromicropila populeti TaxID=37658 RepID=A0A1I6HRB2_9FIRM|nr:DUF6142 family protein [Anaeromicropila populeti]SFR57031.1 hypothetical protein SAMN05661086_00193 [Anaeromicropila populeti]
MRKKKSGSYTFSDRVHPVQGIISAGVGGSTIIAMLVLFFLSSRSGGNGGIELGVLGVLFFVLSSAGLILAVLALKRDEIHYRFPLLGLVWNGIMVIIYFLLYIVGAVQ